MRNLDITYTKAVGIILMVMLHAFYNNDGYVSHFVSMFHMPLFFFFSGYCLKESYLETPAKYVKRRVASIYWPYLKWTTIFVLLHNVFYSLNIYNSQYGYQQWTQHPLTHKEQFHDILIAATTMNLEPQLLGGYWFMKSLFLGSLIAFFMLLANRKLFKYAFKSETVVILISILICFFITILLTLTKKTIPYFLIGARHFYVACIYLIGYYFAKKDVSKLTLSKGIICFIGVLGISVMWPSHMNQMYIPLSRFFQYTIAAVSGTWVVYSMPWNKLHEGGKILQYIGNNTLTILTFHFLSFKLVSLLIIYIYGLPVKRLGEFYNIQEYAHKGWWIAYTLCGVSLPLLFKYLLTFAKERCCIHLL